MQSPVSFLRLIGFGAVLAIVPFSVRAQNYYTNTDWNHFGLNLRMGFNIRARFSEPSAPLALPGPGNHQYTDGYVDVDSSGNQGGATWDWGYQHASQVQGGNILMHTPSSVNLGGASEHTTDDPNLGFDFNYVRDLGHEKWGQWGIKIGFGYTHVQIRDNDTMSANLETTTDAYPLDGVTPPVAPYSGTFAGPGPLLGATPTQTTSLIPGGAIITGNHNIDAALYDLRLGPAVNIPLFNRFSVQAGGGLAVGIMNSHFTFSENLPAGNAAGGNRRITGLPGAYAEVGFAYQLCRSTSLFTGVQYEYLEDFQQNADGRSVKLNLGQTIFYELGLEFQF